MLYQIVFKNMNYAELILMDINGLAISQTFYYWGTGYGSDVFFKPYHAPCKFNFL